MIILSGANVVLPNRLLSPGSVVVEEDRIVDVAHGTRTSDAGALHVDLCGCCVAPGFVDVHVHGVDGTDTLDGPDAIGTIAKRLVRYGVTAFCPTTVACAPRALRGMLEAVRKARGRPSEDRARVLPAHLESNFINPDYGGAQPAACLRRPPQVNPWPPDPVYRIRAASDTDFDGADVLLEIERACSEIGIITLAPELDGCLDLIRLLVAWGRRVSLGHSGASYDVAMAAIAAGARHATHLFNCMTPLRHREPGLAGAVMASDEVAAELICDGHHVHPAVVRMAVAAKKPSRIMAVTDGTAVAGLPAGAHARLGGQSITISRRAACLGDGTLAGGAVTMNLVFRMLTDVAGLGPVDAATLCSTTPARELGLQGLGVIAPGAVADLVVLDRDCQVVQTYVGGRLVFSSR